jgi:hypothetical protein
MTGLPLHVLGRCQYPLGSASVVRLSGAQVWELKAKMGATPCLKMAGRIIQRWDGFLRLIAFKEC